MRAAIYSRVSSDEQVKGYSLDAQQEACMGYIKEFKHELYKIYVDDGYSAKNMNRPALQEMLVDMRNKQIDIIIIWRLDRLTRKALDGLRMVDEIFTKYNVSFATIMERHDLTTAQGRWMFTMSLANAQNEREINGERVVFGQRKKAANGRRVSLGLIYGYDVVEGKLQPNDEAPLVRRIFEWYVYKGWGYGKIAKQLNDEGVPAKKTVWQASTIKGILKNITYIGNNKWKPRGGEVVENTGEHPAIIQPELFTLAQTQLQRRGALEMSRSSYNYPFSSIIKCGACGASYTAYYTRKPNDANGYCNYRCGNKKPGLCKEPDIAGKKFEKLFFDYFVSLEFEEEEYVPLPTREEIKAVEKEKSRITRELKKLEKRKSNLLDDRADRVITIDDYRIKDAEIKKAMDTLRNELDILEPPEVAATVSPAEVISFISNLQQSWTAMTNEEQKFVMQMMFKRIEIRKGLEWEIIKVEPA